MTSFLIHREEEGCLKTEAEMERFIGRHSRGILEPGKDGRGKKKKKNPLEPSKEA